MVNIEAFGRGKRLVTGIHIAGFFTGCGNQFKVLVDEGSGFFGLGILVDAILLEGLVAEEVVAVLVIERIGPGFGIHEVGAPVQLLQGIVAVAASLAQERAASGVRYNDDVDEVCAKQFFKLLLQNHGAVCPSGGGSVVVNGDLDGELAAGGFQLGLSGVAELDGEFGIEALTLGILGKSAVEYVVLTIVHGEALRGNGVDLMDRRIVAGVLGSEVTITIDAVEHGLTEVFVVDGDGPVLGFVLGSELGFEVETEEVGIVAYNAGAGNHLTLFGIAQPIGNDVGTDVSTVNLAAEEEFGCECGSFGVAGLLDALDVNMLGIPVVHVLGVDALFLGLELGKDVSAVEPHGVVVKAVVFAKLSKEGGGGGPIGTELQSGQEVRAGLYHVINQGQVVNGFYTQIFGSDSGDFGPGVVLFGFLVPVRTFVDNAVGVNHEVLLFADFSALLYGVGQQSGGVVEQFGSVYDPAVHQVAVGAVHSGIADVTGSGHVVVSGYGILLVAVRIVPILAGAQMEGPGKAVFAYFPGFGAAGQYVAEGVVLNKGIDGVGADYELVGGAAYQIVHGGHFAGIQRTVHLLVSELTAVGADVGFRFGLHGSLGGLSAFGRLLGFGSAGLIGVGRGSALAAGEARYYHHDSKQHSKRFLHCVLSFYF